jgi:asparagine synthase (glutamine-hydrolysing)
MCGIAGVINWGDRGSLARMTEVQAHRGPDDAGVFEHLSEDGTYVGLGSRRLAILDLSPAGHMPMSNEVGDIWIVYNGEIYNFPELRKELLAKGHQFRSRTDTEVIVHLYEEEGQECVKRLNGMFALAICDLRGGSPSLFLARDHFGIKPLYYIHQGHRLAFASEVKALLQLPDFQAQVDLVSLNQYLTLVWVPEPQTMFQGIAKLPAGHFAIFKDGTISIKEYWDLTFPPAEAPYAMTEPELREEIQGRFRHAVQSQMISDVPIGAFLSAGLDSSSIVAMMSQPHRGPVQTYTITFPPRYRLGETTLDDPDVARRVARHFKCRHQEIMVEPQVTELLPKLIWHMDDPVADPAIITAYLVCREARRTVTVLLSGIGGDELFAGYRKHYSHFWAMAYQKLPSLLRHKLIEPIVSGLPALRGTSLKGLVRLAKKMARSASLSPQDAFLMNCTYLDEPQKGRLYTADLQALFKGMDTFARHRHFFQRVAHADFLNQMLYLDVKTFMVSLNLNYNDKMSMASSVEVRVPFLDRELAEFVAHHVPPQLKLNGFFRPVTKYIFRQAMRDILPAEVFSQPKAGFFAPVDYWLAYDLREMMQDLLAPERISRRGYFQPAAVHKMIDEHLNGAHDWSMQLWQLLTLELWLQVYLDAPVSRPESR